MTVTREQLEQAQARLSEKITAQTRLIDAENRQLDRLLWQRRMLDEGLEMLFEKEQCKTNV